MLNEKTFYYFFHKLVQFIIFLTGKIQTGVELIDPGLYSTGIFFRQKIDFTDGAIGERFC